MEYNLDDYEQVSQLGSGQFGVVHKWALKSKGRDFELAIKTLPTPTTAGERKERAENRKFDHENVIKIKGINRMANGKEYSSIEYSTITILSV